MNPHYWCEPSTYEMSEVIRKHYISTVTMDSSRLTTSPYNIANNNSDNIARRKSEHKSGSPCKDHLEVRHCESLFFIGDLRLVLASPLSTQELPVAIPSNSRTICTVGKTALSRSTSIENSVGFRCIKNLSIGLRSLSQSLIRYVISQG